MRSSSVLMNNSLAPLSLLLLLLLLLTASFSTTSVVVMSLSASSAAATSSWSTRKYDLVIYGATGFTGQLAAEYVHKNYPNLKYALAGRNLAKLMEIRTKICGVTADSTNMPALIVADAMSDNAQDALNDLAASTKVIANYAGTPFIDKALPVVQACVKHGTCYTDITGLLFVAVLFFFIVVFCSCCRWTIRTV
jgi:Saccharopine dehydrogenase NADP binding domain